MSTIASGQATLSRMKASIAVKRETMDFPASELSQIAVLQAVLDAIAARDRAALTALIDPKFKGRFWGGLIAREKPVQWGAGELAAAIDSWARTDPRTFALDFDLERLFASDSQVAFDGFLLTSAPATLRGLLGLAATSKAAGAATRTLVFAHTKQGRITEIAAYFDIGAIPVEYVRTTV